MSRSGVYRSDEAVNAHTRERRHALCQDVWRFCEENYSQPGLQLDECAYALSSSRRAVQRALSDHGYSWRRVLLSVRIEHACRLLSRTDMTVGTVGAAVGYVSAPQFAKAFRRETGMTPSGWRDHGKA